MTPPLPSDLASRIERFAPFIRRLIERLDEALTGADIEHVVSDVPTSQTNALLGQCTGLGIIYEHTGEISLVSPFGLLEAIITIDYDNDAESLQASLQGLLDEFCVTVPIDSAQLSALDIDNSVGFWVCVLEDEVIETRPRFLSDDECADMLAIEDAWSHYVGECANGVADRPALDEDDDE